MQNAEVWLDFRYLVILLCIIRVSATILQAQDNCPIEDNLS
jgi:hypothetical protein